MQELMEAAASTSAQIRQHSPAFEEVPYTKGCHEMISLPSRAASKDEKIDAAVMGRTESELSGSAMVQVFSMCEEKDEQQEVEQRLTQPTATPRCHEPDVFAATTVDGLSVWYTS